MYMAICSLVLEVHMFIAVLSWKELGIQTDWQVVLAPVSINKGGHEKEDSSGCVKCFQVQYGSCMGLKDMPMKECKDKRSEKTEVQFGIVVLSFASFEG